MKIVNDVTSAISHKYRECMVLPLAAIDDNFNFVMTCGNRFVITQDGVKCEVIEYEERHICELEDEVRNMYGIDVWNFIKRWYKFNDQMESMIFVKLKLKRL